MFYKRLFLAALAASLAFACVPAAADPWPARAMRIIVPFSAGGAQDMLARTVGERLAVRLKQPVIIDNRAGAAGNLGADILAKSAPDGYTFGVLSGVHTANAGFYRKLRYDLGKDFVPVRPLGESSVLIVARNGAPFKDAPTLLAYAKQNPGKVSFGSTSSLVLDLLKTMTGAELTMITYKGLGEALVDLVGERIDVAAGPSAQLLPLIQQERLRPLAVASTKRMAALPGVKTLGETVPGYDVGMWYGLFAPAGTPAAITRRVEQELDAVLREPEVATKLAPLGIEPAVNRSGTADLAKRIESETARWKAVAARTGNYAN